MKKQKRTKPEHLKRLVKLWAFFKLPLKTIEWPVNSDLPMPEPKYITWKHNASVKNPILKIKP